MTAPVCSAPPSSTIGMGISVTPPMPSTLQNIDGLDGARVPPWSQFSSTKSTVTSVLDVARSSRSAYPKEESEAHLLSAPSASNSTILWECSSRAPPNFPARAPISAVKPRKESSAPADSFSGRKRGYLRNEQWHKQKSGET